ncbi:Hypothetical protein PHPALM_7570 [Phytophthora palmivora]|uniref:HAT C-terminal dimerisation domain-containing protein n=1 Tax=Phytophthora palmivora TaxID=4796 RepID=A0A2P4YC16_9STRA|nr:Hypothetical protein PHPALM_7570 [Phytophthora palmivora]
MFAPRRGIRIYHVASRHNRLAEDELERWLEDPVDIARNEDGTPAESVLQFWQKLEHRGDYRIIPKVVRVLFAIPSSSCQIERDFSVSGNMVTTQRTSLAEHNVDICSFLNRNREFVNLLQCEEIPKSEHHMHIPTSFVFEVDSDMDMEDIMSEEILAQFIPSTELYDEEEKSAS